MASDNNSVVHPTTAYSAVLEKGFSYKYEDATGVKGDGNRNTFSGDAYHIDDTNMDREAALRHIRNFGSISISPELFEKIYLSPRNNVKGNLRKIFANPRPVYAIPFHSTHLAFRIHI